MQIGNYTSVAGNYFEIFHPDSGGYQPCKLGIAPDRFPASWVSCPTAQNQSTYFSRQNTKCSHFRTQLEKRCLPALTTFLRGRAVSRLFRECRLLKMPGTGFSHVEFLIRMRNPYSFYPTPRQVALFGRISSKRLK